MRLNSVHARLGVGLLAAVLTLGGAARADRDPAEVEAARALFKEAKELRQEGELQRSLEKFRAAYDRFETPITALELGRAYILTGKLVEGQQVLASVEALPPRPGESEKAVDARAEAQELLARLRPRLAWVSVATRAPAKSASPRVFLDGALAEKAQVARAMNPGRHTLTAESGEARARVDVELREGERRTVTLTLTAPGDPAPVTAAPEAPGVSPLVYGGFALAGAGVAVGTVTGIISLSRASSAKPVCVDHRCPPEVHDDVNAAKTMGTVSTVAFVAGAAGAAVAIGALLWTRPAAATRTSGHASVTPMFGLGTVGLRGWF